MTGRSEAALSGWERAGRPLSFGLTLALLGVAVAVFAAVLLGAMARGEVGYDAGLYLSFPARWLATGEMYYPEQFAGTYQALGTVNLYPPLAMYLFAPMSALPRVLWWAVPLGIIGGHVWTCRPSWWSWPIMAACLAPVSTSAILIYGNSDLWAAAIIALATRRGWAAVALIIKPTVFPLALLFARDRRWWIAAGVVVVLALPFGGLWLDYATALRNLDSTPLRSINALPWLALPVVAWLGRTPGS